ncbi:hypothetical protein JYU34_007795 [Plutella xylostella]|uniref:Uncharacterized protein n=1 Tax=Plutella xylostella TaxID=51655 RepID=A0ABQ7QR84_PLUXY|nr:hypothetical protein JYU34_007795 [Plutella xylostella]
MGNSLETALTSAWSRRLAAPSSQKIRAKQRNTSSRRCRWEPYALKYMGNSLETALTRAWSRRLAAPSSQKMRAKQRNTSSRVA